MNRELGKGDKWFSGAQEIFHGRGVGLARVHFKTIISCTFRPIVNSRLVITSYMKVELVQS